MPSGKCKHCGKLFDTKDGGAHCSECDDVACPECEETCFGEKGAEQEECMLCYVAKRISPILRKILLHPPMLKKLKERLLSNDIVD